MSEASFDMVLRELRDTHAFPAPRELLLFHNFGDTATKGRFLRQDQDLLLLLMFPDPLSLDDLCDQARGRTTRAAIYR